jgi:uncharacterized membrane protein YbhN (UPF0104 family)
VASEQAIAGVVSASEPNPARGVRARLHLHRILIVALVVVVIGAAATLFGWDISGWLKHLWSAVTAISIGYLLAGIALITLQTTTTAYAWYSILRCGYPDGEVRWVQILACYAAAVALNSVLPANLGTLAMLLMFTTIIAAANFAGVLGGIAVQKIFYTLIGTFVYLYLFLTIGGAFDLQLGFISAHPVATVILVAGIAALIYLVARMLRERIREWWGEAKVGGQILTKPKVYLGRVLLPEVISYAAMLGIIAVFLAAYNIPVSFHTIMRVVAGNSIANATSVTPGGAGVVQGFNVLSLKGITSAANANAYSVAQQLVTTAWGIIFAIVLLVRAFGWSDGRTLVAQSYGQAKEKSAEQSAARKAKRHARRETRHASHAGTSGGAAAGDAGELTHTASAEQPGEALDGQVEADSG